MAYPAVVPATIHIAPPAKIVPFRPRPVAGPVAVIDDDLRFIRLIERVLRCEGIDVQPVTTLDIDEAIHVVEESQSRAALVDVFMYGDPMGFSIVERLRAGEATRGLPIVVTTGDRREVGRHVDFLQHNECSVLLKPFDINDLVTSIKDLAQPDG
jgi:DNA-binding response OmpR family regulator